MQRQAMRDRHGDTGGFLAATSRPLSKEHPSFLESSSLYEPAALGNKFCPSSLDVERVFLFSLTLLILNAIINLLTMCACMPRVSCFQEQKVRKGVGDLARVTQIKSLPMGPHLTLSLCSKIPSSGQKQLKRNPDLSLNLSKYPTSPSASRQILPLRTREPCLHTSLPCPPQQYRGKCG